MVRRPFFGQSDTKIAKMDMQAATAPGRAYRDAFQKLGDIASDTLEKFREKKEEKKQQELSKNQIVNLYKGNPDHPVFKGLDVQSIDEAQAVAADFSKQPELLTQAMSFAKAATDQKEAKQALEHRNLQIQQILKNMERQESADQLVEEERNKAQTQAQIYDQFLGSREMVDMPIGGGETNHLMKNVPPPTIQVPQGEYKGNRFLQTEQGKSDFTSLRDAGMDASDALEIASKREAQFLANQPKPMTPKELADLEAVLLSNKDKQLKLNNLTNPKPTANLAYTDATINAISDAESLLEKGGLPVTGFWGNMLKDIAGTGAADLKNSIVTIKSAIGFDKLQDMRDKSPTGGALGQVSERELAQLNASLGSLEQSQSAEQFKKNLMRVKDYYQKYYKATMAQVKAYEQGLKFDTEEEAMSWYDQNFPMGGKPTSDNQTNITTRGGWKLGLVED